MSDELHTFITALRPPSCAVRLTEVTVAQEYVLLQLTATAPTTCGPRCAMPSSSEPSRYQRQLTDLPSGSLAVRIQLTVRKFVCRSRSCARRIFTERLPDFTAPYARHTTRLAAVLQAIGIALGGQAGARLAALLGLPTSATTLLRLLRGAPRPQAPAPQVVGIDEWAWRRGHRYGTILVDLQTHRIADLQPDRSAASVAAWLAQYPTITAVCRDRSELYADGIRWTDSMQLWREIRALGYTHSARTLSRLITALRRVSEAGQPPETPASLYTRPQGPSARAVSFTLVCPAAQRSAATQTYLDQLCQIAARIARAYALSQAFLTMVRERRGHALEAWMAEATDSEIEELAHFARGLQGDLMAITAGLTLPWSNGVTEGQIHRLKLCQGYG
jgi:transposase